MVCPSLASVLLPRKQEGAGNAGCWPQPMARQQKEKLAADTTGPAEPSGIPCAMVLTFMARSPQEPGFLAPVARKIISRELGLSVGRPGPHAFASASAPFVRTNEPRASPRRPSHPRSTYRDDRPKRPSLVERGMARIMLLIYGRVKPDFENQNQWHCDRMARRAIPAWHACTNCPPCSRTNVTQARAKASCRHCEGRLPRSNPVPGERFWIASLATTRADD